MQKNTNEYYKYIRSHIDIADVCKALDMQLRPMGKDYITQCFLHSDEHPSLRIFTEENRYHCFQCGENGDIFQLVKGKLDCDFTRALSWLEEHFPQVLSEKPDVSSEQVDGGRSRYADGFELAWDCYRKMTEEEEADLRLFAEKRGYAPDFLKESEVVFVSKQKLKNQYGEDERFIEEQNLLQEAGLEPDGFRYAVEEMGKEYPVVHSMGLLTGDHAFLDVLETGTLDVSGTILDYHTLQYYRMFEEKPE